MEDRQDHAVGFGVLELVQLPGGGQGSGLRLAVTHHAGGDEVRVIRHSAESVGQAVTQLTALVDGTGRLRGHMAGDAAGEGELLEQLLHAFLVPGDIGIDLCIRAVQPVLGHHGVAAVAGAGNIDHIQIILFDDAVQVGINKVLTGHSAPVTHNFLFYIIQRQFGAHQGIFQQIQLTGGQIVGRTPVGIHMLQRGTADRFYV